MRIETGDYLYILPYMRSNPRVSQQFHDELSKLVDVSKGPDDVETLPMVIIFRPTGRPDDEFVEIVLDFIQDRQYRNRDKILITALSASKHGQTFTPKVYAYAFKAIFTICVSSGSLDVSGSRTSIASLASLFIAQYGCQSKRKESPKPAREERNFFYPSDTYRSSGYTQRKRESDTLDNTHISQKMQRTSLTTANKRTDSGKSESTERRSGSLSTDDVTMVESSDILNEPVFPDLSEETHDDAQENTAQQNDEDTPQEHTQKTQSWFSMLTGYFVPREEPVTVSRKRTRVLVQETYRILIHQFSKTLKPTHRKQEPILETFLALRCLKCKNVTSAYGACRAKIAWKRVRNGPVSKRSSSYKQRELTVQREPSPQPSHSQEAIKTSSKLDVLSEQTTHKSSLSSYLLKPVAAEPASESHILLEEQEQTIQPSSVSHQIPKLETVEMKSCDTERISDSRYTEEDGQTIRKGLPFKSEDSMTYQAMDAHVPQYQTLDSGMILEQPQISCVQRDVAVQTYLPNQTEAVSKREFSLQKEQRTSHTGFGDRSRSFIPRPISHHQTYTQRKHDSRSSDMGVTSTLPSMGTDEVKTRIKDQEVLEEALTDMEEGLDSLQTAVERKFNIRVGFLPRVIRSVLKEVKIPLAVKESATITDFMQPHITRKIEDEFQLSHWSLKCVIKDVIKSTLELQRRRIEDEESRGILNEAKTYMEGEENQIQTNLESTYKVRPGYLPRILTAILGEAKKRSTVPAKSGAEDFLPLDVQEKIENLYALSRGSVKGIIDDTMKQYLKMQTPIVKMEYDRDTLQNALTRMENGDETIQRPVESRCNIIPGQLPRILRVILADLKKKTPDGASSVTPQVRKRITLELSQGPEEETVQHYVKQHQKMSSSFSRMDTGEQSRIEHADVVTVQPQRHHGIVIRQPDDTVQKHTSYRKEVTSALLEPDEVETRIKDQEVLQEALTDMAGRLSPVQSALEKKFNLRSGNLPHIIRSTLKEVKIPPKVKQSASLTDFLQPQVKRKIEDQCRIGRGLLKDVIKLTLKLQRLKAEHEENRGILTDAKSYLEQIQGTDVEVNPMQTNLESKYKIKHGELCRILTAILQEAENGKTVPVTSDAKDFLPANIQVKIEKTYKIRSGSVKGIIEDTMKQYLKIQTSKLKMEHDMDTLLEALSEMEKGDETTKRVLSFRCGITPERLPAILRISLADLEKRTPDAGSSVPPHVRKRITPELRHGSVEDTVVDHVKKYLKWKAENDQKDRALLEALQEALGKMEEGDVTKQAKVETKFNIRPGSLPRILRSAKEELEKRYPSNEISDTADVPVSSVQRGIEEQFSLSEGSLKDIITAVIKTSSKKCTIQ